MGNSGKLEDYDTNRMKALNSILALLTLTTLFSCARKPTYNNANIRKAEKDMRTVKLSVVSGEVIDTTKATINALIRGKTITDYGYRNDSLYFALLFLVNKATHDTAGFYTGQSGKITRNIEAGNYDIVVYHQGYIQVVIENVQFKKSEIIELNVLLESGNGTLKINGRNFTDSLIAGFYNTTLANYFTFYADRDEMKFGQIVMRTDVDTCLLLKQVGTNRFKFLDAQSSIKSQLSRPMRKNKGRTIYRIDHTYLANDTIDVNIQGWVVLKASYRNLNLRGFSGSNMGYIPEGRFIYNGTNNTWDFFSQQDIINQRIKGFK